MSGAVNAWWLVVEAAAFLVLCICMQHIAYNQGIWDGAFNQFLPRVRKQMHFYDDRRARKILAEYDREPWL